MDIRLRMNELELLDAHRKAYLKYEAAPSFAAAQRVHRLAADLVKISDDHQAALDEADDLLGEHEVC